MIQLAPHNNSRLKLCNFSLEEENVKNVVVGLVPTIVSHCVCAFLFKRPGQARGVPRQIRTPNRLPFRFAETVCGYELRKFGDPALKLNHTADQVTDL